VIDEIAFMDRKFFDNIIVPLALQANVPMFCITTPQEGWFKDMTEKTDSYGEKLHNCLNFNTICDECMAGDINAKLNCNHVQGGTNAWRSKSKAGIFAASTSKGTFLKESRGLSESGETLFKLVDLKNFIGTRSDFNTFKDVDYAVVYIDPGAGASETAMCIACYGQNLCSILWLDARITKNLIEFNDFVVSNISQFRNKYDPHIQKPLYVVTESNLGAYADQVYLETINIPLLKCFKSHNTEKWGLNKDKTLSKMYVFSLSLMMGNGTIVIDKHIGTANPSFTINELLDEAKTQLSRVNDVNGNITGKTKSGLNDDMAIVIQMASTCHNFIKTEHAVEFNQMLDWVKENKHRPANTKGVKPIYVNPRTKNAASAIEAELRLYKNRIY
jgi:hypothetical protein